jgi:hypothetical protein
MPVEPHGLAGGKCYATPDGEIRKVLKIVGDDLTDVSRTSAPAREQASETQGLVVSNLACCRCRPGCRLRSGAGELGFRTPVQPQLHDPIMTARGTSDGIQDPLWPRGGAPPPAVGYCRLRDL